MQNKAGRSQTKECSISGAEVGQKSAGHDQQVGEELSRRSRLRKASSTEERKKPYVHAPTRSRVNGASNIPQSQIHRRVAFPDSIADDVFTLPNEKRLTVAAQSAGMISLHRHLTNSKF